MIDKVYPDSLIYDEAVREGKALAKLREFLKESEVTKRFIEWLEYSKRG